MGEINAKRRPGKVLIRESNEDKGKGYVKGLLKTSC